MNAYRRLLAAPGTRTMVASGAVGRVGNAMFGVGVVAMIAERTGSYTLAGAVSAFGLVVFAITALVVGRLIDSYGQRTIALPLVVWATIWAAVLILVSVRSGPTWALFVTYGLGAIVVELGTMSRARWAHLLTGDPARLHTAMSLEQVLDELSFVFGPVLAIFLATLWPEAGYATAVVLYVAGTLLFLAGRRTEPPARGSEHKPALAIRQPGLWVLALVLFMIGVVFGGNEVVTLAVSDDLGQHGRAGVILGLFAAGSAIAALIYGARDVRRPLPQVLVASGIVLLLLQLPILFASSVIYLGVVMLVAGVAVAPTLITSMKLAQEQVPTDQVNEALSVVLTSMLVGIAMGSALAGIVVDHTTGAVGYVVPVAAAALLALTAAAGHRTLQGPKVGRVEA